MAESDLTRRALARYMQGRGGQATINRLLQMNPNFLRGVHPPKPPAPADGLGTPPVAYADVREDPSLDQRRAELQRRATVRAITATRSGKEIGAGTQGRLRSTTVSGTRQRGIDPLGLITTKNAPLQEMLMAAIARRRMTP